MTSATSRLFWIVQEVILTVLETTLRSTAYPKISIAYKCTENAISQLLALRLALVSSGSGEPPPPKPELRNEVKDVGKRTSFHD